MRIKPCVHLIACSGCQVHARLCTPEYLVPLFYKVNTDLTHSVPTSTFPPTDCEIMETEEPKTRQEFKQNMD